MGGKQSSQERLTHSVRSDVCTDVIVMPRAGGSLFQMEKWSPDCNWIQVLFVCPLFCFKVAVSKHQPSSPAFYRPCQFPPWKRWFSCWDRKPGWIRVFLGLGSRPLIYTEYIYTNVCKAEERIHNQLLFLRELAEARLPASWGGGGSGWCLTVHTYSEKWSKPPLKLGCDGIIYKFACEVAHINAAAWSLSCCGW